MLKKFLEGNWLTDFLDNKRRRSHILPEVSVFKFDENKMNVEKIHLSNLDKIFVKDYEFLKRYNS